MYNHKFQSLLVAMALLFTGCGPVKTRVHTSPAFEAAQKNLQQTMRDETIRRTKDNTFFFQPDTKECRNSKGTKGYNLGIIGPCALITDADLIPDQPELETDLKGSVFFNLNLKKNTSFKGVDLENTTWVNVNGTRINFEQAKLSGSQFHHCMITDLHDKPVQ